MTMEAVHSSQDGPVAEGAVVVVIPAYNEAGTIGEVIASILARGDYRVLVVNDASGDATCRVAREAGADVLDLPVQLGAWGATQAGLRYVERTDCAVAVTMDADGQHLASSLEDLLRPLRCSEADVSIGACRSRGSALRQVAWRMMKLTSSLTPEDITSGMRAYNRKAVACLVSEDASLLDYPDVGVLLLLQSQGLHVVDVQVKMQERSEGGSRVFSSWFRVGVYMLQTLLLGLSKRPLPNMPREKRDDSTL